MPPVISTSAHDLKSQKPHVKWLIEKKRPNMMDSYIIGALGKGCEVEASVVVVVMLSCAHLEGGCEIVSDD